MYFAPVDPIDFDWKFAGIALLQVSSLLQHESLKRTNPPQANILSSIPFSKYTPCNPGAHCVLTIPGYLSRGMRFCTTIDHQTFPDVNSCIVLPLYQKTTAFPKRRDVQCRIYCFCIHCRQRFWISWFKNERGMARNHCTTSHPHTWSDWLFVLIRIAP